MKDTHLQYKPSISLKSARDKISAYGMFGDHQHTRRPKSPREVALLLLSLGTNPDELAKRCRDYREPIPYLQNLLGSTWIVSGHGKVEIVDNRTGEVITEVEGPGTVALSTYLAHFETACAARDRAVENSSYADLQTAIVYGIASVESYITELARDWNQRHPDAQLADSKHSKVSLDDKFDFWIPEMSNGAKLIKNDRRWNDFVKLRRVRDNETIHPKLGGQGVSFVQLAKFINAFRWGIAGMLGQLHLHFGRPVPSTVINAVYMPDVEVVEP